MAVVFRPPLTIRIVPLSSEIAGRAQSQVWENPLLTLFVTTTTSPFTQNNWPNPTLAPSSPLENRTIADSSEFWMLQDTFYGSPGQVPTYGPTRPPWGADRSISLLTWLQTFQTNPYPFIQSDWPNPRGFGFPLDARTIAGSSEFWMLRDTFFGGPGQPPTYGLPLPPKGSAYGTSLLTWLQSFQPSNPTPFTQSDWPNPWGAVFPLSLRTVAGASEFWMLRDTFFGGPGQPPTYVMDRPPLGPTASIELRTWLQTHVLDMLFVVPLVQRDWPNPSGSQFPVSLRTWLQSVRGSTITPFYLDDWPVPLGSIFPIGLRTFLGTVRLVAGKDTFFGGPGQPPTYDPIKNPRGYPPLLVGFSGSNAMLNSIVWATIIRVVNDSYGSTSVTGDSVVFPGLSADSDMESN